LANEWLFGLSYLLIELLGLSAAVHAVLQARTAQGATAWSIGLVAFPLLALPLYAIFGRRKFQGYVAARAADSDQVLPIIRQLMADEPPATTPTSHDSMLNALEKLAKLPFSHGNQVQLLINGQATFAAILTAIEDAKHYILVQFYTIHDDRLGRALKRSLRAKADAGVAVYLLYDGIGSHALPNAYAAELRAAGVRVEVFTGGGKKGRRFQINFRNHRKIVVIDGQSGYLGGHNVGDEYLGRDPRTAPWRDTHVCIRGPAVLALQIAFTEDWYWVTRQLPALNWRAARPHAGGSSALIISSGPADAMETCSLMFVHAINSACHRAWLVSPYFVPDESVVSALQLATLRGVDVRILIPQKSDNHLVHLAGWSYLEAITATGIQVYRYTRGFLHQKVMLIDDHLATVGTANLDNRSFRLNFEATALIADSHFAGQIQQMLEQDFAVSKRVTAQHIDTRSKTFMVSAQLARLFAPVL
jgi:cardiolipin synthase